METVDVISHYSQFCRILASLQSNDFSIIDVKQLPISSGQIVKAAGRFQEQLLEEAFGFSIMARNIDHL
jgi:hypothetical protein